MAGGTWVPAEALLNTVGDSQSFSHNIQYYEEVVTVGGIDPLTGLPGPDVVTQVYYPVNVTQVNPRTTVTTSNGDPATISGLYQYVFNDVIIYRDFNDTIKTLSGSDTQGSWEQLDMNDCYQIVEFIPDAVRYRRFEFNAEAIYEHPITHEITIMSTKTYYIDVRDYNWTPGMNALKATVATIRSRGN